MRPKPRSGFTVLEVVIGLGLLLIAAALVGEVAVWSVIERSRMETRLAAIEWTANVLESAKAMPWDELTPQWAATQTLPPELAAQMNAPVATVRLETDPQRPRVKRITAEASWKHSDGTPAAPVSLTGYFAAKELAP